MQSSFKRIVTGLFIFALTVCMAVGGYVIAGWTLLDAIYMVVITIFGVGYGEVQPLESAPLKVFTILVIIAGALSTPATFGTHEVTKSGSSDLYVAKWKLKPLK